MSTSAVLVPSSSFILVFLPHGSPEPPGIVFVDRGSSFYNGSGKITREFDSALRENQFTAFHGRDASIQPGRCGDLWLHETAVSWVRERLNRTLPKEPWKEREEQFAKRGDLSKKDVKEILKSLEAELKSKWEAALLDAKQSALERVGEV